MNYYLAPMEGITRYVYRDSYAQFYGHMDKYFSPFIAPSHTHCFNTREKQDISPDNNKTIHLIPQILTNCAEDFIKTANALISLGYSEINLNLGCPSGTVVSKYKGSGFLAIPDELDRFLYQIFSNLTIKISIKTRIGKEDPKEFTRLMKIYNQYPLEELIIHPRTQTDFYKNTPNWAVFGEAISISKHPICYNGDIFTKEDYEQFHQTFPMITSIMFGRGIITNPALIYEIKNLPHTKQTLWKFHEQIYQNYHSTLMGEKNVLFKMKELWFYMIHLFEDSEKIGKKIKKSRKALDYETAVFELFQNHNLVKQVDTSFLKK